MASGSGENSKNILVTGGSVQMNPECKVCGFCEVSESKYVCPRCGVPYCSVNCYRSAKHINCSEQFYRESVESELKDKNVDPRQMEEILSRIKDDDEELDSDDEEDVDLADRMANIDLNDADAVWGMLTESERAEFQEIVSSGDVSKLVQIWEPWWTYFEKKRPVQDLNEEEFDFTTNCPKILNSIPSFSTICKVKPNSSVKWNLVNAITAYAYCVRYYNNEHFSFPVESASILYAISKNLNSNQVFQSFDPAVDSVIFELTNGQFSAAEENIATLKSDVSRILAGPSANKRNFYVIAALSDCHCLFEKASKESKRKSEKTGGRFSKMYNDDGKAPTDVDKKKMILAMKKIDYYLSWSNSFYSEAFDGDFE